MNFITKNLHLKILALISAIVLWFFVVGIENAVYLFPQDIEIQVKNMPENLNLVSGLGTVKLRINVTADLIKNVNKNDFEVSLDLKDMDAGEYTLPITAHSTNDKITILKIEPPVAHIRLESVQEKEVPIKITTSGSVKKGYKVKDIELSQETGKISGFKDLLAKIKNLTAEIKLNDTQSENFTENIPLEIPKEINQGGKELTIAPQKISVTMVIIAEETEKEIEENTGTQQTLAPDQIKKVVVVQPKIEENGEANNPSRKIEVLPLTVAIQGTESNLRNVNFLQTEPIKLTWLRDQKKPVKVKLVIPSGVTLENPAEKNITLTLKEENTSPTPSF